MPDIFDQISPGYLQGAKPTPSKGLKFNDSSAAGAPQAPQTQQVAAQTPSTGDIFDKVAPNEDIFDQLSPDDAHYRQLYRQQKAQGLGDVAKGALQGVKALKDMAAGTAGELGTTYGQAEAAAEQGGPLAALQSEGARRQRASLLEGLAQTGRNYLNMATKDIPGPTDILAAGGDPVGAIIQHEVYKPGGMVRNLLKKTGIINPTPEQEEAEYQAWKQEQMNKEAQAKTPAAPAAVQQFFSGGAEPLPQTTAAISMAADPLNYLSLGGAPAAQALRKIQAGAQVASAAEKAASMAGSVLKTGGKILEKTGELPETLAQKVTEGALGPQAGEAARKLGASVGPISAVTAAIHGGAPETIMAGLEGAKRVGKAAQGVGEAAQALAEADRSNPFGRLAALAKDPDAPEWMRYAASSPLVKAGATTAGAVRDVAVGGLHGAGIGAALGAVNADTPEEFGESVGQMAAIGGAGRALTLPAQNKARVMQKMANAAAELYHQHVSEGVSPETLKKVSDSTMMTAAAAQKMFGDVRIRFLDGESGQFADQATKSDASPYSAGFWDPTDRTIYLNADSGRGADTTLLHELIHPLFDSVVANRPELKAQIDSSLQQTGKTLDQAKRDYVEQIVGEKGFADRNEFDRAVNQYIDRMDKGSAAIHNDSNHWIYSEIMAEAGMKATKGKNIVTDIIDPSLTTKAVQASKGLLEGLGVKFKESQDGKTILPNFEDTITNPALRKSTYELMRAMKDYRPGIDEPAEQGVKITPETLGQHPGAPVHVLPNGELGNDFMAQSASGQVVQRPNRDIRKIVRNRRAEVNAAYPLPQTEAPTTSDPRLQWRKTPSGLSERSGTTLGPDFDKLRSFSDDTKQKAKDLESAIANGEARQGWYQQIGEGPDWRGSVSRDTGNVVAQHKQFLPINFHVDKAGNVLVRNYSLGAFNDKAQLWSGRHGPLSLDLWDGNVGDFKKDVTTYLDNHKNGLSGDTGIGNDKKNVINAFLVGKNVTWEKANPLRSAMRGSDTQGIVRSYRLDRLETLAPHDTELAQPDYAKQVKNLSPLSPEAQPQAPAGVDQKTFEKGVRIEAQDHPEVARQAPHLLPQIAKDELRLEPDAYKGEKDPGEVSQAPELRSEDVHMSPDIKDPRAIRSAAVVDKDTGKIYEGPMHYLAYQDMLRDVRDPMKLMGHKEGFVDNSGNFLDRQQAYARAEEMKQLKPLVEDKNKKFARTDLISEQTAMPAQSPDQTKTPIEVTGPDGKKYKATYDGDQDFTAIGGGKVPQITLLGEVPGFTKNTTTYGPSLEKKGFKFEIPSKTAPAPAEPVSMSPDEPKTFMVRHGSTEMNNTDPDKDLIRGHIDIPLDKKGRAEARAVGKEIADKGGVDHIIASDLIRTKQTANAIAAQNPNATIETDPRLRPWSFGPTIEGKPTSEMIPKIKELTENPDMRPPGGETFNEFKQRFLEGYNDAQTAHADKNTAIVTHYRGTKLMDAWRAAGVDNNEIVPEVFESYDKNKKPGNVQLLNKAGEEATLTSSKTAPGTTVEQQLANPENITHEIVSMSPDKKSEEPKSSVKAYKLFRAVDGKLYPLFVDSKKEIPMGQWLKAEDTQSYKDPNTGRMRVKSKLGDLAYRPGWHAGDLPYASHIGVKDENGNIVARRANEVWAEVEMAADKDYQDEAIKNGTRPDGRFVASDADLDRMPENGYYRYKTNPNMTGDWMIGGNMKVNRVLPESEVNRILRKNGVTPMPWENGKLDLKKLGIAQSPDIKNPKAIKTAAVRTEDGEIFEGKTHQDAYNKAIDAGYTVESGFGSKGFEDGFVDNQGRFLSRAAAYRRMVNEKQFSEAQYEKKLLSLGGEPELLTEPRLEAATLNALKKGKEAPSQSPDVPREMPEDKALSRYANRIVSLTNTKGGASFDVMTGKAPTKGFSTSLYPDRTELVEKGQLTPETVKAFAQKNADLLAQPDHVVGTWNDKESGKTYLDVSYIAPNENIAKHAGQMFNQKAVWDIKEGKEVATGGTGEPMENMPEALQRVPQAKASFEASQQLPQGEIRGPVPVALPEGTEKSKGRIRTIQESQHLDLEAIKNAPDTENYRKKVVEQFRTQPGFRDIDPSDTNKAIDEINSRVQQNLQFLYDRATPENRALWKQWYDFAHDMSHRWGKEYGIHGDVVAAINARLSPQMEWNNNVTLTRRALDTIKKDPTVTEADKEFLKAKILKEDTEENPQTTQSKNLMNRQLEALAGMKVGDKMSELNELQAGMLMRSHNEIYAPRSPLHDHNLNRIPGDYLKWSKPFQDLADVVSIYRNPSFENVSNLLGGNHKVRSFYNNHVDPTSPLWTTIDTHATAAANLYPYGGSDQAVVSNFGNPNHKNSGVNGVYPVYQDAYEKVAKANGILPRELQSIVWEQMRKELNPAAKRMVQDLAKKSAGGVGPFEAIWARAEKGEITREEAQKQIVAEFEKFNAKARHGEAARQRAAAAQEELPGAGAEIERMKQEFEQAQKRGNAPLPARRSPPKVEEPNPTPKSYRRLPEQPF